MQLLDDYKSCLNDIVFITRKLKEANFSVTNLTCKLNDSVSNYEQVSGSVDSELAKAYDEALNKLVVEKTAAIHAELEELRTNIQTTRQTSEAEIQAIKQHNYMEDHAEESQKLTELEEFITASVERFKDVDSRLDASITEQVESEYQLDLEQLLKLKQLLEESFSTVELKQFTTPIEKVVNILCFDVGIFKAMTPFSRTVLYFVWTIIIFGNMLFLPVLFVVPYLGFYLYSVWATSRMTNRILNLYYPYVGLRSLTERYKQELLRMSESERERDLRNCQVESDHALSVLEAKLRSAQKMCADVEKDTRAAADKDQLTSEALANLQTKMAAFRQEQEGIRQSLAEAQANAAILKQQLEEKKASLERLRKEVTENYLRPKEAGSSKVLPDSFFLGFDGEGNLMEFTYDGLATMIEYRGAKLNPLSASKSLKDIILMMSMQLAMTVDITCLTIHFIDTYSGGIDYALFKKEDLDAVFDIVATNDEVKQLIETLHATAASRSAQITVVADNIDAYNKMMIARKSFTMDYHILIFQTVDIGLFGMDKFLQLCKNGPIVGIVPLIFVPTLFMAEVLKGKVEARQIFSKFLDSINPRIYCYDTDTFSLEAEPPTKMGDLQRQFGED